MGNDPEPVGKSMSLKFNHKQFQKAGQNVNDKGIAKKSKHIIPQTYQNKYLLLKLFYICIHPKITLLIMNNLFTKRTAVLMIAVALFSSAAFSQFDNVDFLKSATADGVSLLEA